MHGPTLELQMAMLLGDEKPNLDKNRVWSKSNGQEFEKIVAP